MTHANCLKYIEEAKTEKERKFWEERTQRKYGKVEEVKEEIVKEEIKPKKMKVKK